MVYNILSSHVPMSTTDVWDLLIRDYNDNVPQCKATVYLIYAIHCKC